jgi:drug/metabolite transporter (DMT)-like permease
MHATKIINIAGWILGLFAALAASLLTGMYSVFLVDASSEGASVIAVWAAVTFICFACIVFLLRRLNPLTRLVIAMLIFGATFALLPQPTCASEPSADRGC